MFPFESYKWQRENLARRAGKPLCFMLEHWGRRGSVIDRAIVSWNDFGSLISMDKHWNSKKYIRCWSSSINIGWVVSRVRARAIVHSCHKCLGFGHSAKVCKNEEQRCLLCEGTEEHSTGSYGCPVYRRVAQEVRDWRWGSSNWTSTIAQDPLLQTVREATVDVAILLELYRNLKGRGQRIRLVMRRCGSVEAAS